MFDLWLDVRHAFRRMAKRPRQTGLMLLALGLGIGANTAVFSVVDATLWRPLPFTHASRIVDVIDWDRARGGGGNNLTPEKVVGWQAQSAIFERFEAYAFRNFDITEPGAPERASGGLVSSGLFPMLGVSPRLGRAFGDDDGRPFSEHVVIVSERVWRARFGGDPSAIGRTITLNDQPYRVIGVMPESFRLMGGRDQLWLPLNMKDPGSDAGAGGFYGIARLAAGVTVDAAQQRADVVADKLQQDNPLRRTWGLRLSRKLPTKMDANARTTLVVLLTAVGLVLLLACANTACMFLAQMFAREQETAVRASLGASRGRLIRSALVESMLLSAFGGLIGLLIGSGSLSAILAAVPANLTTLETTTIGIDIRVLAFMSAIALLTGMIAGAVPACRGSRPAVEAMLRGGGQALAGQRGSRRWAAWLLATETAVAVVLLVGAMLMMRTLVNLHSIDPGFDLSRLHAVEVELAEDRYPTESARAALLSLAAERIATLPAVSRVAFATGPMSTGGRFFMGGGGFAVGVQAEAAPSGEKPPLVGINNVSPAFFDTLRLPLVAGRGLNDTDRDDVVVVSQPLARYLWPDGSALGRRIRHVPQAPWRTVVGIAGGVEMRVTDLRFPMQIYFPAAPRSAEAIAPANPPTPPTRRVYWSATFLVRTAADAAPIEAIKAQLLAIDPKLPIEHVARVQDLFDDAFDRQRFVLLLMSFFAAIAVALAACGIFAVASQLVAERTREIGVRTALGATRGHVVRMVMSHQLLSAAVGLSAGLVAAAGMGRFVRTLLYEVGPTDAFSYVAVGMTLIGVAILACWLPTRRALRIEPAVALREN
jgi:putative ABC transport system permease protein